jgi:hypothetical protein
MAPPGFRPSSATLALAIPVSDSFESGTHSFVVRIWLEEAAAGRPLRWRGHITHIPSDRRQYVESLEGLVDFIEPYIQNWDGGRKPELSAGTES